MEYNSQTLSRRIKDKALALGFDFVGIASASETANAEENLEKWISMEYFGTMYWIEKRASERGDIHQYFPEAKTVISVGLNYYTGSAEDLPGDLKISNYAWGEDYHDLIKGRLFKLLEFVKEQHGKVNSRVCVDTSPVMDKVWAQKAGLGWIGKHTNLITREMGSWLFLGELILDIVLDADQPFAEDLCGSCSACLDACPTDALVEPYVLDARRCISYLTIENRQKVIPEELSENFEGWIYGCDICQQVCPWNIKFNQVSKESAFQLRPEIENLANKNWQELDEDRFRKIFKGNAARRTGYTRFQRNIQAASKTVTDYVDGKANFDSENDMNSGGK